jgi:methionyl-tRNA formyltransferase
MVNIVFFGSSEHSVIILSQLLQIADFHISLVVTKIDKPVGRLQTITPNPIAAFAQKNNLNLLQVEEFTPEIKSQIKKLKLDLGLCVAFGPPYFDQEMIDIPKAKIVNIHPSPLPKYRGATPGPWQIINGETQSAVTFFQIDTLPDHGPIIHQIPFTITPQETSTSFYQKAFTLASEHLESVLKNYLDKPDSLQIQDHSQRTYFPKFTKDDAQINWSWDSAKIERFIRALNPWPTAWTYVTNHQDQKFKIKIFSSTMINHQLVFDSVQIEGKKITNWSEISKYYNIDKS